MAKYSGLIGFTTTEETSEGSGVFVETTTERHYKGDVEKMSRRRDSGQNLNDDILVNNVISITADAYAFNNLFAIRYVKWMGAAWKVTNVDVRRPRLILTIGGVYNGPVGNTSGQTEIDSRL